MLDVVPFLFFNFSMQSTFSFGQPTDFQCVRDRLRAVLGKIYDEQRLPIYQFVYACIASQIASATLNFSTLRKRAFVVDTHVLRVMQRFGFMKPNAETEDVYDAVMSVADEFDADDLCELHWHIKELGQEVCTYYRTLCVSCPLSDICLKRVEDGAVAGTQPSGRVA